MRQPGSMEVERLPASKPERDFLSRRSRRARGRLRRRHGRDAGAASSSPPEDYGGLAGQVPRGAGPAPPRRDRGRPCLDGRGGRPGRRDGHVSGLAAEARRMGLGEHTSEINRKAAEIARNAVGEGRFVAGSIGPTGFLPASDDPTLGDISFRRLVEDSPSRPAGCSRAGRTSSSSRPRGHPRGQGRDLRHQGGVQGRRPRGTDPGLGLAPPAGRQDAARHGHRGRGHDADGARR